jgi:hypothetical protein
MRSLSTLALFTICAIPAFADDIGKPGSFPLSSKGVQGTLNEIAGVDTHYARMLGSIAKADVLEYCERDPGSVTKANGGKMTLQQCVKANTPKEPLIGMSANCDNGRLKDNEARWFVYHGHVTDEFGIEAGKWTLEDGTSLQEAKLAIGRMLDVQYAMLCPSYIKTQEQIRQEAAKAPAYFGPWNTARAECPDTNSSETYIQFLKGKVNTYEGPCKVTQVKSTGANRWTVSAECQPEGELTNIQYDLRVQNQKLSIKDLDTGYSFGPYHRCPF